MAKRPRVRRYTPEFIEQAVRLVVEGSKSQNEVAEELGVGQGTLSRWVTRSEGKADQKIIDVPESVEDEVKRLRKRVRELELEKEILKNHRERSLCLLDQKRFLLRASELRSRAEADGFLVHCAR